MIRLWRKVRKNFAKYQAAIQSKPLPGIVHVGFNAPNGQLNIYVADRNAFADIFHAYLGLQIFSDRESFLKMGYTEAESEEMAWKYLERYQAVEMSQFHYFLPVKVRHFQQKLAEHLTSFSPGLTNPIAGKYQQALSLVEHPHNTQMVAQTDQHFAYFQFSSEANSRTDKLT